MLRRELATIVVSGELRDPRLGATASWSITDVEVSPDLSRACVYVDVLDSTVDPGPILEGLRSSAGAIRGSLGRRIHLKRTPQLRFEIDDALLNAARIDLILGEIRDASEEEAADASLAGCSARENECDGDEA